MFPPMGSTDAVDVWIVDLDRVPARLRELLSNEERDRAAALRDELGEARWIASRAVLRAIVGERLGVDPRDLAFELGPHGKLRLRIGTPDEQAGDRGKREALDFNLSHSGPIALYALASGREVGIDVERADRRRPTDELALARRMLGRASAQRLAKLPERERFAAFLREWTAQEARAKCLGIGLGEAKDGAAAAKLERLWVCELDISGLLAGAETFAALAVSGGPVEVRKRVWEGSGRS